MLDSYFSSAMGTQVQCKSYLPGYHSMKDLNADFNSCSWPLYYGDKTVPNGQYYNDCLPRVVTDEYSGHDKDVVKQTMLEHEAIFRNQVYELHRVYRLQRDLMDDIKRKELNKNRLPFETPLLSSPLPSHITSEGAQKWHIASFPLANSVGARLSVSAAEDNNFSFSSIKGNTAQAGSFPCQNGGSSKDNEVLDSRATKFHRKILDLQLPADEYIDSEDGKLTREEKDCGISSYLPNGNSKNAAESGTIFSNVGKTTSHGDALRSETSARSTIGLADLNKPVQVEDSPAYVDLLDHPSCHGAIQSQEQSAKSRPHVLGLPKEISPNSHHGINNGRLNSLQFENNGNGSGWFSHVLDAGSKSNLRSFSQGVQPEKLPIPLQPIQALVSKEHEPPPFYQTDQSKIDLWRGRTNGCLGISERTNELSNYDRMPSLQSVAPSSSDLVKSWSHSVSSWQKPGSTLSQKPISFQMHPYLNSSAISSKSSQSLTQSDGVFGDRWHLNSNSRSNSGFGSEFPYRNGFYHGSSSGSKLSVPLSSISYDYLNCSNDYAASTKHYKGSNCVDLNDAKDVNLNALISNSSSNETAPQRALGILDRERKQEDHLTVLPWLRSKSACKNESTNGGRHSNFWDSSFVHSSPNQVLNKGEAIPGSTQLFTQNIKSFSWSDNADAKRTEIGDCPSNKKVLGFSIFEKHQHLSKGAVVETNGKIRALDINLPCDSGVPDLGKQIAAEVLIKEKRTDMKSTNFRHDIDLNSCISEDESSLISSVPSIKNITTEIDLEEPVVPEPEEDACPLDTCKIQHEGPLQFPLQLAEHVHNKLATMAAEAIVAISSSVDAPCKQLEASTENPLHWFVKIISSCGDDLYNNFDAVLSGKNAKGNEESSLEEDYFESMTLKLTETKAEEYMPVSFVPEILNFEESGVSSLPNRPRRGQSRRGRQRRDFQRDILPGLTSLARHEVTEDLQTFGGLMRATGYSWQSGLARRNATRNGCGRRRRRSVVCPPPVVTSPACTPLVQQLNNIEVGLDERSLTGWGKTTRRPRRQRCPPGNPPSQLLT